MGYSRAMRLNRFLLLAAMFAGMAPGQSFEARPASRTAEIEQARDVKEKALRPDEVTRAEGFMRDLKDKKWLQRITTGYNGFNIKIGNMVTGGGFAAGPEFRRTDLLNGNLGVRASAQFSTRGYQKYEAQADIPRLLNQKLELSFLGSHRNYGGLNYYGPGPDSLKIQRTNYRLEDTAATAIAVLSPTRHLKLGGGVGGLWVNVGPGTDSRFASTETVFTPAQLPGLDHQTNHLRTGVFSQFDYRDNPNGPKAGGNYVFQYVWYNDVQLGLYGFRRMDIDAQQYIPFLNKTHRIALRAKGTFTESDAGQTTPFYLQPVLGGSDDLRGFRPFRFSDRNKVVYNGEYQWEIFAGLDGALFFDAGKVMPRRGLLAFSDLETSAGFGLRFNVQNATFMRIDVGFSHEGFQIWFKFNDVFNSRRYGISVAQPVY
jgi:outer membrane protein assembly factor BamA